VPTLEMVLNSFKKKGCMDKKIRTNASFDKKVSWTDSSDAKHRNSVVEEFKNCWGLIGLNIFCEYFLHIGMHCTDTR
jgi:hypothetical protein